MEILFSKRSFLYFQVALADIRDNLSLEIKWKREWFTLHEKKGFWKKSTSQRLFLNEIAKKYQIVNPEEWGKINNKEFIDCGGSSLLATFGSVRKVLQHAYPGIAKY